MDYSFSKGHTMLAAMLWQRWMRCTALLCMAAVALALQGCREQAAAGSSFYSHNVTGASYGRDWRMPDTAGVMRDHSLLQGPVSYVFFGFTQCPEVCPTTMLELAQVKELLGSEGVHFQVVFVSVDPERDMPEILRAYLDSFDASAIGLVGSTEQLASMAREFKVFYQKVPLDLPASEGSEATQGSDAYYTMDHSAGGYVYDRHGKLRLYSPYGAAVEDLAADVRQLLSE